ncbi:MAG: hypothetical protein HY657_01935 [Acidobacteria bacterium]|nr:hypothetical protein [Acidobacteriota bacterium]
MDDAHDGPYAREPQVEDLARICQALNDAGARYAVVRIADEIVVDLMARACGIEYREAAQDATNLTIADVVIPVASLSTLIRTKDTIRPSDAADRRYLEELLEAERRQL